MKVFRRCQLLAVLGFIGTALAVVPLSSVPRVTSSDVVPGQFIVEVSSSSDIPSTKRGLSSVHEAVYAELRKRRVAFQVNRQFNSPGLFTGAAVTLSNPTDIAQLKSAPGVVAIRPVIRFPAPKPVFSHVVTGVNDPKIPPDSESTHVLTGVDKLHAQGILGNGVKIGIVDTGIDWTHPSLGAGIGPGHKIIGGFDFVGDNFNGSNTPVPDNNPLDQCNGHGTHVAGIIGANPGNEFNISGVAYEASIASYRVFGCTGDTTDDIIIEALLRGVSDGMDILTMSLGGSDGWTESSSSVVSSRIAATGKIVTIAAGNDGSFGSWYTSSPGNAINAISVASLDNTVTPLQNATVHGVTHDPIPYFELFPFNVSGNLPIFATSTDITIVDDACDPLPDSTPDLSNFLTVIRRGTCTFVQKLTNAAAKGAQVVFIYDNGSGFDAIDTGNFTLATLIQADDGQFLVQQFAANAPITISFPQTGGFFNLPDDTGGLISSFSSYGPTEDMFFKPAVAAPGGNILSTFPVPLGSFAILSGTSMATPFIAASGALLFSVKGKNPSVGLGARTLFETTAQRIPSSHTDGDPLQTVSQQGAGLVNVFNAIHATTIVSPGELLLNDTANFRGVHTITLQNNAAIPKTFKLSHIPAGTAVSIAPGDIFASDGPVPLTTQFATVKFSKSSVLVLPFQTASVTVSIAPPAGVDETTFPVYSGFIQFQSGSEQYQVTYLGVAAALKNKQVTDNTSEFFGMPLPALLDSDGNVQSGPLNYTFVDGDFPTLLMRLAFGTPLFQVDLVEPNINFKATLNKRAGPNTFAQVPSLGQLLVQTFQPRNSDASDAADGGFNTFAFSTPTFANGTTIPNGSYKALLRVLRVTGDPTKEADFESFLSPVFGVFP